MTIGEKIKLIRAEKNISLRKLAEDAHLSKSTISDIENNKSKNPTKETLEKICAALGISISSLLSYVEDNNNQPQKTISEIMINDNIESEAFIRCIARAKDLPKESLDKIARHLDFLLDEEGK